MYTWTHENVLKLIDAYKPYELLWDTSHRDYKNKTLKNNAWKSIAETFNLNKVEVETKIHTLRTQFAREHKKIVKGENHNRKVWFGYDLLKFLLKNEDDEFENDYNHLEIEEDCGQSADSNERFFEVPNEPVQIKKQRSSGSDDDIDHHQSNSPTPTQQSTVQVSRKRRLPIKKERNRQYVKRNVTFKPNSTLIKRDEITIFGEYIISELRKVKNDYALSVAKNKISNIIFNAQIGRYNIENQTEKCYVDEN